MASLDTRGIRESNLHSMFQRIEPTFKQANKIWRETIKESLKTEFGKGIDSSPNSSNYFDSPSSSIISSSSDAMDTVQVSDSFRIQIGRTNSERLDISKRYEGFVKWLWAECYNARVLCAAQDGKKRCSELLQACEICYRTYMAEDNHCSSCHKDFKAYINISEHLLECEEKTRDPKFEVEVPNKTTIGVELLKAQLALVEACLRITLLILHFTYLFCMLEFSRKCYYSNMLYLLSCYYLSNLLILQVSLPAEALKPSWTDSYRKSWGLRLSNSSSPEDIFQVMFASVSNSVQWV